ncbi:MAG: phosphate propanoyltransferase [Patescibacteria group bacterium]
MKTPIAISARHIHLCQKDLEQLFGKGYQLTKAKDLKQKGEFASKETVTLKGPKGDLDGVRILGPVREQSQVEISKTDARRLGIVAPVRLSGNLSGSGSINMVGPKSSLDLKEGVIVAKRHIHLSEKEAKKNNIANDQIVSVKVEGDRELIFNQVVVRVSDRYQLEMHLDTDEANAADLGNKGEGEILINVA